MSEYGKQNSRTNTTCHNHNQLELSILTQQQTSFSVFHQSCRKLSKRIEIEADVSVKLLFSTSRNVLVTNEWIPIPMTFTRKWMNRWKQEETKLFGQCFSFSNGLEWKMPGQIEFYRPEKRHLAVRLAVVHVCASFFLCESRNDSYYNKLVVVSNWNSNAVEFFCCWCCYMWEKNHIQSTIYDPLTSNNSTPSHRYPPQPLEKGWRIEEKKEYDGPNRNKNDELIKFDRANDKTLNKT